MIQLKTAIDLCNGASSDWASIGKLLEGADSKQMALPDFSDTATHSATYLDRAYKYDNNNSRTLLRSGYWNRGSDSRSGLCVTTYFSPTSSVTPLGFRAALSIGSA